MTPHLQEAPGSADIAAQLRQMSGPELARANGNALRRVARSIRKEAVNLLREHGIGRTIWGHSGSGAMKVMTVGRLTRHGGTMAVDITAKGIPALVETGGRTKAHPIAPQHAKVLRYVSAGELRYASGTVEHKGSHIRQDAPLARTLDRRSGDVPAEVEREVTKMIEKVMRG